MLESLNMPLIVLASGSPRRHEMLEWTGWDFITRPVETDESRAVSESPELYVSRLAETKARAAVHSLNKMGAADLILAADTTVADENRVLGKPLDEADARQMLLYLRDRSHEVFTALAIYRVSDHRWFFDRCHTLVAMRDYSDEEIEAYVLSGDPMDKAGAYAIQNKTFHPVTGFNGCFANVMGLPLCHLVRMMKKIGIVAPVETALSCQKHLDYDCPVTRDVLAGLDVG